MQIHFKCPKCLNEYSFTQGNLSCSKFCTACGTGLALNLNMEDLKFPVRDKDYYTQFQDSVRKIQTDHRATYEAFIITLAQLSLVDTASASTFLHSIMSEGIGHSPGAQWVSEMDFKGVTEFPSDFANWNESRPLLAKGVESVLLIAIRMTFMYGIFDQITKYALVSSEPISHMCADHQVDNPAADDMLLHSLYVVRTGDQQYLCYNKSHFVTPLERLRRIQGR